MRRTCAFCYGPEGGHLGKLRNLCPCQEWWRVHAACQGYMEERTAQKPLHCDRCKVKAVAVRRQKVGILRYLSSWWLLFRHPDLAPYYKTICRGYYCEHYFASVFKVLFVVTTCIAFLCTDETISTVFLWMSFYCFLGCLACAHLEYCKPMWYLGSLAATCKFA